jgi:hypothetical protein
MPLPIVAAAMLALPVIGTTGKKVTKLDPTFLIVGGLALWWLSNRTAGAIQGVTDKANIVPESGQFLSGLFRGADTDYSYAPDQSGSPNPPTQLWWEMAQDLGATERGPIAVPRGVAVPTSPIIIADLPGTAEGLGSRVRDWFTSGALLRKIDPIEYTSWGSL